jgi:hypothetical protein
LTVNASDGRQREGKALILLIPTEREMNQLESNIDDSGGGGGDNDDGHSIV